jgi:hypothetical protein
MKKIRNLASFFCAALLCGCLGERDLSRPDPISAQGNADDTYIRQLGSMGFRQADIRVEKGAYVAEHDLVFSKETLDRLRSRNQALAKSSQARVTAFNGLDIKNLDKVARIRVYIKTSGVNAVGPNWAAGVRSGMSNWNAVAGVAANFTETTDPSNTDITITTSTFSDYNTFAQTGMYANQFVNPAISVDAGREDNTVFSAALKTHAMMHELGHALNIGHTDQEGGTDGALTTVNIAGTPHADVNSVFNSTISVARPFSANDLNAMHFLYPSGAVLIKLTSNDLYTEGPTGLLANVKTFQQDNDTYYALLNDGTLMDKNGLDGAWVTRRTAVLDFRTSGPGNSRYGVLSADHRFFTSWDGGSWLLQQSSVAKIDMDGTVFATLKTDGSLWGTWDANPQDWINLFAAPVSDFQLEGSRIAVLSNGNLYLKDSFTGTWGTPKRTGVQSFQLNGNRIATLEGGTLWASDGINGPWYNEISGVTKFQLSGPRIGALVAGTLYVKDGLGGAWVNEYGSVKDFQLTNYYISLINSGNTLLSKYDFGNSWQTYSANALAFGQR